nr:hypothetical protein [Tanacetum cinerariifolium]
MNGWLEEDDDVNEKFNNEDIEDEDVEVEVDDEAELIFHYEVEGDQTLPPRDESFDSEPPRDKSSDSVSSDSESEDEEANITQEATVGTVTQRPFAIRDFPRGIVEVGESSAARDSSYVGGLTPWALRRDLDTSYALSRLTEAELSKTQAEIALLKSKNKIREKERKLLDHDLGDVKRTLNIVLETLKVLESKVQTLQTALHGIELQNQQLQTRVADIESHVGILMSYMLWMEEHPTVLEKRLPGPPPRARVDNTKTQRPQSRSNTKNDRVPSASKSSRSKNKGVEVEEHHRKLLLSRNKKHMSSECNNVKLATHNVKSKVVYAMCKQCLNYVNHDVCLLNYVNGMTSRGKKQKENV